GALVAVSAMAPATGSVTEAAPQPPPRRRSRAATKKAATTIPARGLWRPVVVAGATVSALLVTLGYAFISTPASARSLSEALAGFPASLLPVAALVWIGGSLASALDETRDGRQRTRAVTLSLGVSLGVGAGYALWQADRLASIAGSTVNTAPSILGAGESLTG